MMRPDHKQPDLVHIVSPKDSGVNEKFKLSIDDLTTKPVLDRIMECFSDTDDLDNDTNAQFMKWMVDEEFHTDAVMDDITFKADAFNFYQIN